MVKYNEVSSTEKLLELIRSGNGPEIESSDLSGPHAGKRKPVFINRFLSRKTITVGVDIDSNSIKLVKIVQLADKKHKALDCLSVPFESGLSPDHPPVHPIDSPMFSSFLQSTLSGFCGNLNKVEIWSCISPSRVEVRYLRIPRIAKKQIPNAVYWTFRQKVPFNEKEDIFDFEILGDIIEDGAKKIEILSYSAPKKEIELLRNIFSKSGYPLTGITIIPFAFQNLFKTGWIKTDKKSVCNLFISNDWSLISIYSNGNLMLLRGIKAGIQSMIESIRENLSSDQIKPYTEQNDNPSPDKYSDDESHRHTKQAQKIFFDFINGSFSSEVKDVTPKFKPDLKEEDIFEMILPALDRLVRQVEITLEHYSLNFSKEKADKVFLSSRININRRIVDYIDSQIDIPVNVIDPSDTGPNMVDDFFGREHPAQKKAVFIPALSIALSKNLFTPNMIHTYKDKKKVTVIHHINQVVFAAFLIIMAFCIGTYFWMDSRINQKKIKTAQIQQNLNKYSLIVDQDLLLKQIMQTNIRKETLERYADKYLGTAVISEISDTIPLNIRLLGIIINSGEMSENKVRNNLVINGIVLGDRLTFESSLAGYLVKLKSSPVFGKPVIKKKVFEVFENKEILRFTAQLELI